MRMPVFGFEEHSVLVLVNLIGTLVPGTNKIRRRLFMVCKKLFRIISFGSQSAWLLKIVIIKL